MQFDAMFMILWAIVQRDIKEYLKSYAAVNQESLKENTRLHGVQYITAE